MEKIWLRHYPEGVPPEVGVSEFHSLGDFFEQSVARYRDRTAYVNLGKELSYDQLEELSRHFAAFLQTELTLPPGARVAIMLPNVLQYPVVLFGILRAGYTVVNCNPLYTPRELAHQLKDSGAECIVVLENFAHTLEIARAEAPVRHVVVTGLGDLLGAAKGAVVNFMVRRVKKLVPAWRLAGHLRFHEALARGAACSLQPIAIGHQDNAFLQYTGGTTGPARGVVLSHGNVLANLDQAHAWIQPFLKEHETIVTALPLYHIFSLTANCLTFLKVGASNVLITNPRDIPAFIKELAQHRFSVITGVNTLFNALLNHPDFARLDFSALHIALGGGMAVQQPVAERWQAVTGTALIEAYGLTETSPAVCINPLNLERFNHSIGLPVPSTEISIRDDAGRELPIGSAGELCVRGPQVTRGYWRRPQDSAQAFTVDGFLRTGDIAVMDEQGFTRVIDRKKDMILVSGFNVSPSEVEEVLASHPEVLEVAAVGISDERSGEAVKVFVVPRNSALDGETLLAYCREQLSAYKVPRQIEFREELPKTNVGKILRRALRPD